MMDRSINNTRSGGNTPSGSDRRSSGPGRRTIRAALLIGLCAMVSACLVGPDYHRPPAPTPTAYEDQGGWAAARPADAAPKGDWWTDFHDPLLDELEPQVAVSNQTVQQDLANYNEALAEVRLARSELYPTIGVSASATREAGVSAAGSTKPINVASLEGTAAWTPDLWGQVRRLIEENAATAQADQAILANATLSEQTLLATTVIELRLADANIDLEQHTVEAYQNALRVTQAQGNTGISATPPSAVITAQVALETTQASLISLGVARAEYEHAIGVLVGKTPEEFRIPKGTVMPTLPQVPVDVPSTLLQRRPDIAAAERTMKAQNATIGIAIAAYYPSVPLSASAGFAQSPLAGLLHAANHVWSVGATGTETIFDFGARSAQVQAARAAYEGAVASYRSTVLNAFEEVENDLSNLRILAAEASQLDIAVRDARRGTDIALAEFEAGTVDYTTVAAAQEVQLADQQSALNVQESRLVDAVSLIGDLGGGWSAGQLQDPLHP